MQTTLEHITLKNFIYTLIAMTFLSLSICGIFIIDTIDNYDKRTTLIWSEHVLTNQNLVIHSTFHRRESRRSTSWYEIALRDANKQVILHQRLNKNISNISRLTTQKEYPVEHVSLFIAKDKNGKIVEKQLNSAIATIENGEKIKIISGKILPNHHIAIKKTRNLIYINIIILGIVNLFLFFSIIYLYQKNHKKSTALAVVLWIFFNLISLPILFYAFRIL